ncbi:MAG: hypothetical protein AB7Q37_03365 [Pyrinomonadaceae bacterium]
MNAKELKSVIEATSPQARTRVERAVKQWNQSLREHLRTETGLRLTDGQRTQSVAVKVVDGMPQKFAEAIGDFGGRIELLTTLPKLEASLAGLAALARHRETITGNDLCGGVQLSEDELARATSFIKNTVENLGKKEVLRSISAIDEDLMGAYFFYDREIVIYWMPMALMADLLGVGLEALTVVTLAHELAHAYTHLGYDIDGENWNTEAFAKANVFIVEGLAQWYTAEVCTNIGGRNYDIYDAYEKDVNNYHAESPYSIHQVWEGGFKVQKEVVRLAMLKCRKQRITDYEGFENLLLAERDAMPGKREVQTALFR